MSDSKKCNNVSCNNVVYDRNKKTKELKKYCSNACRYSDHSEKMIKHPRVADAPICKYHLCDNFVTRRTTGIWKVYCSKECQNKEVAHERSDISKIPAPVCQNPECNNIVLPGRNGHWKTYCSRTCAGKYNSIKSREKAQQTYSDRYGHSNFQLAHLGADVCDNIDNKDFLTDLYINGKIKDFIQENKLNSKLISKRLYKYGIIDRKAGVNLFENSVIGFLNEISVKIELRNRSIIRPYELDIVLPEFNLAIECNGSYWHSELNGKDRNYHLNKTIEAKKSNYDVFHIWEHQWNQKSNIIKSIICSKLGKISKIYARTTTVKSVLSAEELEFLNRNHIQGYVRSSLCYGLYYNDELVSLMSFGKSRFKGGEMELLRFCNKLNTTVVGGASKLFKHYIGKNNALAITSYAHRDKFTGNLYQQLGFKYSHSTAPSYYYTKDYDIFENRLKYQKHKLPKLLENFNESLTEWENMQNNGFDRIWDCGNDVWVWEKFPNDK